MSSCNYGPDYNYTGTAPQISFIAKTGERLTPPRWSMTIYPKESTNRMQPSKRLASFFLSM